MEQIVRCSCKQSHGITFCSGLRCVRKESCHRYSKNHKFSPDDRISMAQFADHNGKCDKFYEFKGPID